MTRCRYCNHNLSFTQLKCPVCRNYVWRSGHLVVGTILTVIAGIGTILGIDYMAVNKVPEKPPEKAIDLPLEQRPGTYNPGGGGGSQPRRRSNPNHPRPAHKRQR